MTTGGGAALVVVVVVAVVVGADSVGIELLLNPLPDDLFRFRSLTTFRFTAAEGVAPSVKDIWSESAGKKLWSSGCILCLHVTRGRSCLVRSLFPLEKRGL